MRAPRNGMKPQTSFTRKFVEIRRGNDTFRGAMLTYKNNDGMLGHVFLVYLGLNVLLFTQSFAGVETQTIKTNDADGTNDTASNPYPAWVEAIHDGRSRQ